MSLKSFSWCEHLSFYPYLRYLFTWVFGLNFAVHFRGALLFWFNGLSMLFDLFEIRKPWKHQSKSLL